MRKFEPEMQILRLRLRMITREGFEAGGSPPMRKLPGTTAVSHGTVFRPESENATADPSAAPQDDSAKGDDATYFQGSGNGEFSGQSSMERCSARNHENATADPSAAPQDDSAKGDDATYFQGSGNGEFSGQILRLIIPATKTCRWGPRLRSPMATFAQDDKQKHWVKRWWFSRSLV